MADYIYTRDLTNAGYNIDNINHTNGTGEPIPLFKEIIAEPTLPNGFRVKRDHAVCTITFPSALTEQQKTTLDDLVAYHKTDT